MDFLTNPFIVIMLFLYQLVGGSLVLAIIIFTVLTRVLIYPLTAAQLKSSRKMQELQPKLKGIREKYKGDREKLAQAQMDLYRENKINPMAGCLPLLIQMPILFGLYGAIYASLSSTPMQLLDLQHRLLVPDLAKMLPLQNQFLWMNLGLPDQTFILPILVVATTWLQSKIMMPPVADPKDPSAAMSRNMTTIMPLMVGLFSISFASGLSIYWIVGNIAGIVQYMMLGQADFRRVFGRGPKVAPATAAIEPAPSTVVAKKKVTPEARSAGGSGGDAAGAASAAKFVKSSRPQMTAASGTVKPPVSGSELNRKRKTSAPETPPPAQKKAGPKR